MIRVQEASWRDWRSLAPHWQELVARSGAAFFLTSAWVGTWLDVFGEQLEPTILIFLDSDAIVGACLVVRRLQWRKFIPMRRWYLNCAGENRTDETCVEYNRLLSWPGRETDVSDALRDWLRRRGWDELSLDGMEAVPAFADGLEPKLSSRPSYYVDLARLRNLGFSYDQELSANTRQQIRRSLRYYEESTGAVAIEQARDVREALRFLDELAALHQQAWTERGEAGVFASHRFCRFHQRLIEVCAEAGQIHMLRITSGTQPIGLLHNFFYRGRIYFYQSGLAYQPDNRCKPGLVTHYLAITRYLAEREDVVEYDFLAGDSQYKRSLAKEHRTLDWVVAQRNTVRTRAIRVLQSLR